MRRLWELSVTETPHRNPASSSTEGGAVSFLARRVCSGFADGSEDGESPIRMVRSRTRAAECKILIDHGRGRSPIDS